MIILNDDKDSRMKKVFLLVLLLSFSIRAGKMQRRMRVVLLPLTETNLQARKSKLSELTTTSVFHQLVNRPELELVQLEKVIETLSSMPELIKNLDSPETAKAIAQKLRADFVITGYVAGFGSSKPTTYIDVRVRNGRTGELCGWACERSDLVREASMTTSSPASEQMERLGSYIARNLLEPAPPEKRKPVVIDRLAERGARLCTDWASPLCLRPTL